MKGFIFLQKEKPTAININRGKHTITICSKSVPEVGCGESLKNAERMKRNGTNGKSEIK
jgi:hypothetical protein